ncbi:MAG: hypothetical protein JRH07_17690, partial [Deltaproteobacteria bacterium]|nr:hypothetical protein [Deltaproteobacteria bacterium]
TVLLPEPIRPEGLSLLEGRVRILDAPKTGPETTKRLILTAVGAAQAVLDVLEGRRPPNVFNGKGLAIEKGGREKA